MLEPEDFKTDWERQTYREAIDAMSKLMNLANTMGSEKFVVAGMLAALIGEHRTLQQSGIRNFVEMLKEWGKEDKDRMTDLRNHDAWVFAQHIIKLDPGFANV